MHTLARITWMDEVDSTNDEARRHIDTLDNLSVVAARCQTAGRGQGDHTWSCGRGDGLTFSAVLRFGGEDGLAPLAARDAVVITHVVTLALRQYLLERGVEARIKWPNDIWVGDRKICGILIENVLREGQVSTSIVGVGLNLNQETFAADLPNPVSLRQLTGREYDLERELEALWALLRECAQKTDTADGRRYLSEVFERYCFRLS